MGGRALLTPVKPHITPFPPALPLSEPTFALSTPGHQPATSPPAPSPGGRGAFQHLGQRLAHSNGAGSRPRPGCPPPGCAPASSPEEAAPAPPPLPAAPGAGPPLTGVGAPVAVLAVRQVVEHGGGAVPGPRMAAPPARAPRPACAARSGSLARSLSAPRRQALQCPPGAHTLAHGHTLTPARAPSQRRRCSPHPVCRRREPLAGFWGGAGREEVEGAKGGQSAPGGPPGTELGGWEGVPRWAGGGAAGNRGQASGEQTQLRPPAPHSPAQAGPARGQVPSRALKITAGN